LKAVEIETIGVCVMRYALHGCLKKFRKVALDAFCERVARSAWRFAQHGAIERVEIQFQRFAFHQKRAIRGVNDF